LYIFLNAMWFLLSWKIVLKIIERFSTPNFNWKEMDYIVPCFVFFVQLLFLTLLMMECKIIKIEADKIIFVNPLLPFLRKTKYLNEYDYKQTLEELRGSETYEALWLIKNGKLKNIISSFNYANYNELKKGINIEDRGRLRINLFKQMGCLFGMKI